MGYCQHAVTSVLTEFMCRVFVNIFTAVWPESQLEEAITLIFICKSEINDCGYPTPATNSPVTVIIRLHLSACFTIISCLFAFYMNFLEKLRFPQRFLIYGNPAALCCQGLFWLRDDDIMNWSKMGRECWQRVSMSGNVMVMYGWQWVASCGQGDMRQPWHNSDSRDSRENIQIQVWILQGKVAEGLI